MKQSDALTVNLQKAQKATTKTMFEPPKPPPKKFAKADEGSVSDDSDE